MELMFLRLNSQVPSKKLEESNLNTQTTNGYVGMENQLVWPFERHNTIGNSCTAQSQSLSLTYHPGGGIGDQYSHHVVRGGQLDCNDTKIEYQISGLTMALMQISQLLV